MRYNLTPRLLILIAATAAITATTVASAQTGTGPGDSRSALADRLASAKDKLDKTANALVAVEDAIDLARADVDRIGAELAAGRDPKSVTRELMQVSTRVDQSQKKLTEVVRDLSNLGDAFKKIQIAARTLKSGVIAREAALGLRRVRTLQTEAKIVQVKIEKVNVAIQALLTKASG